MMNCIVKYLDYFFVLRPTLFFPVWTVYLANYHANSCFDNSNPQLITASNPFIVIVLLTLLMGSAFIINQLKDILTDRKNKKLFIIADGYIQKTNAILETIILGILAVALAFYLNTKLGIIFICVFFTTGILYNIEPFVWKDKPLLGIVANFLGGITVASAGWITAGTDNWKFLLHACPCGIGLVAVYFLTTLADIEGDVDANKQTFGVTYGFKLSTYFAIICEIITIVFSYMLKDYMLFIPAVVSLPLFLIAVVTQNLEHVLKAVKYTVLFASLAVCVKYPVYLIVLVGLFFFSKWYYRVRFNIEYPKFAA